MRTCLVLLLSLLSAVTAIASEIHDAVREGDITSVRKMITADPDLVNAASESGDTPLHYACLEGQADIAQLLLDTGADPNLTNQRGMTPVRWAIYSRHTDIVALLLDHGIRTDDSHPMFGSLVDQAFSVACQNQAGPEMVELLLAHGLDFDAAKVDALGMSRLDWAAHFGNLQMAQFALEHGADANHVSSRLGRTPLVAAVAKGRTELVDLLLQHGADPSIADSEGSPAIHHAVEQGRTEIIKKLLQYGASVDFCEPRHQRSLLHLAATKGFQDVSELLMGHGSRVDATDDSGNTPLFYAARYGNKKVAEYLIGQGAAKSQGTRENYGAPSCLKDGMPANRATAWYLNHRGWALKTKSRVMVFDAEEFGVRRPDNPGLANGFLTADELKNQQVIGIYSCYHGQPGEPAYIHTLADSLNDISYVHLADDNWRGSPATAYLQHKADTVVSGVRIHTISSAGHMPVLAYLCEIDGLRVYYQAFGTDDTAKLKEDYQYLHQFADTVDLAFLPIPEPGQEEGSDLQLFLRQFPTRTVLLLDPKRREYLFPDVARKLTEWNYKGDVFCAENPGDTFPFAVKQ